MGKEVEALENHTHFRPDLVYIGFEIGERDSVDNDLPFVNSLQMVQAAQECAFP